MEACTRGDRMRLAKRYFVGLACFSALLTSVAVTKSQAQTPSGRVPVLLELFTSEGCSSCPPADKLLEEIDRTQPIERADLVVLSEHVDYWNRDGWTDPYSSPTFTERQQVYASRLGVSDIYTPQIVVDGTRSVVGGNWPKVESAIRQSLREAKISISVAAKRNEDKAEIHVEIAPTSTKERAVVYLVLAHDRVRSQVARGENAGRDLSHVAVAYSVREIASIKPLSAFDKGLSVSLPRNSRAGDTRAIVFVRRSDTTAVIGVAQTLL
jgi:hypothetical protein